MIDGMRKLIDNGFSLEKNHKHLYKKYDKIYCILHFNNEGNLVDPIEETFEEFDEASRKFLDYVGKTSK